MPLSPTKKRLAKFVFSSIMSMLFWECNHAGMNWGNFFSRKGFTLVEITIVIAIFSMIVIYVFSSVIGVSVLRSHVMSKIELEEWLHFFIEQLVTTIKEGGVIDFEEYWNREIVGIETQSGHYKLPTWFWNYGAWWDTAMNFGNGLYSCISPEKSNGARQGTGWCIGGNNTYGIGENSGMTLSWTFQRYWQYKEQFWDYNSNQNDDGWDQNGDGRIKGDDDDLHLGDGPTLTGALLSPKELYMIQPVLKERLFLRWNIKQDPFAPAGVTCTCDTNGACHGSWCIGNIQMLRLVGKDLGWTHQWAGTGAFDGIIDTWVCHPGWKSDCTVTLGNDTLPWNSIDDGWVDIFPQFVNIRDVSFTLAPLKDSNEAYASKNNDDFIHPYVRISLRVWYGWERRKLLRNIDPEITMTTMVSLTNYNQ